MDWKDLDSLIDELEHQASPGFVFGGPDFKAAWRLIPQIGRSFKATRYPTREQKDQAWNRFQGIVGRVKEGQAHERSRREAASNTHRERVLWHAERARPVRGLIADMIGVAEDMIGGLLPGADVFDEKKEELQRLSAELRSGWGWLNENKSEMLGQDKAVCYERLREVGEILDGEWEDWKRSKAAWHEAKQRQWRARQESNAAKLEDKIEKAARALHRAESHLVELEQKRADAWSDSYIERVEGWIEEEESRIEDIRASIERMEGWLEETRSRL